MLHTHDDFLNAIQAQPADRTLRLVYADWLDEHNDPRGELNRIEDEMRQLPVFADRFWELKPRRNELRAHAGSEWCGRMRFGTECAPVFGHGIPDGWRERWRLVREFTERWHHIPMPDVGGHQNEIAEAEAQFGKKLSPPVREWIAFACDVQSCPNYSGELRLAHVREVPGNPALSLWLWPDPDDHIGDAHSAVHFADLQQFDPPVQRYHWGLDEDSNGEFVCDDKPFAPSVTAFALDRVLYSTFGTSSFVAEVEQLTDLYRHLNRTFTSHVEFGGCEWDEADNLLLEIEPLPGRRGVFFLHVRASAAIRRDEIPEFLWRYARLSDSPQGIFASAPDGK